MEEFESIKLLKQMVRELSDPSNHFYDDWRDNMSKCYLEERSANHRKAIFPICDCIDPKDDPCEYAIEGKEYQEETPCVFHKDGFCLCAEAIHDSWEDDYGQVVKQPAPINLVDEMNKIVAGMRV